MKKVRDSFTVRARRRQKHLLFLLLVIIITATGVLVFLFLNQQKQDTAIDQTEPAATIERIYHGKAPNCPEKYCVSITVNGDLLFHPGLWNNFKTGDEREFDFTSLFAAEKQYYDKSDIAVCDLETPIGEAGKSQTYTGYPIFNIPPQVVDGAKSAGYTACTIDTNHSWDQGVAGIERMIDKLDAVGIKHAGAYKTKAESQQPLVLDAEGGKLALIGGTVSLNGMVADTDWHVDRMRDGNMADHDYERMVGILFSMGLGRDDPIVQPWLITEEK